MRKHNTPIDKVDCILIYSLNYIGDALFTTPIYKIIKELNPNIYLYCCAGDNGAYRVLETNPYIDKLIELKGNFRNKLKTLKHALNPVPTASIILEESFESALLSYMVGIKYRIGLPTQFRRLLLTHPTKAKGVHAVERYMSNLAVFGVLKDHWDLDFHIDFNMVDCDKFLTSDKSQIGIIVGTTNAKKLYPPEKYVKLIELLFDTNLYEVNIIGSHSDKDTARVITSAFEDNCGIRDFTGMTENLSELAYLLSKMNVVIGADTGPMHIANSMKVPCVFLYYMIKNRTYPYNKDFSEIILPLYNKDISEIDPYTIYDNIELIIQR